RGGHLTQRTDVAHLGIELRVRCGGEPIPDQVWLQRPFFNSRAAWRGEICATIPRLRISSAISRLVHWLMGRPEVLGASQARATIWHTCSAVIRTGCPG